MTWYLLAIMEVRRFLQVCTHLWRDFVPLLVQILSKSLRYWGLATRTFSSSTDCLWDLATPGPSCASSWDTPLLPWPCVWVIFMLEDTSSTIFKASCFHLHVWWWGWCSWGHRRHSSSSKHGELSWCQRAGYRSHLITRLSHSSPLNPWQTPDMCFPEQGELVGAFTA